MVPPRRQSADEEQNKHDEEYEPHRRLVRADAGHKVRQREKHKPERG